jgi:hypothetical protein
MPEPLTTDEQAEVVAAMIELTAAGDTDGAEALGQLAQDPDELRKVLAADPDDA